MVICSGTSPIMDVGPIGPCCQPSHLNSRTYAGTIAFLHIGAVIDPMHAGHAFSFPWQCATYHLSEMYICGQIHEVTGDNLYCPKCGTETNSKFCPSCGVEVNPDVYCPSCGMRVEGRFCPDCGININGNASVAKDSASVCVDGRTPDKWVSKVAYGLLAIILGGLGIHRFYAGKILSGVIYLLLFWTFVPAVLGLIEGIIALTRDGDQQGRIPVYKDTFFV